MKPIKNGGIRNLTNKINFEHFVRFISDSAKACIPLNPYLGLLYLGFVRRPGMPLHPGVFNIAVIIFPARLKERVENHALNKRCVVPRQ